MLLKAGGVPLTYPVRNLLFYAKHIERVSLDQRRLDMARNHGDFDIVDRPPDDSSLRRERSLNRSRGAR